VLAAAGESRTKANDLDIKKAPAGAEALDLY